MNKLKFRRTTTNLLVSESFAFYQKKKVRALINGKIVHKPPDFQSLRKIREASLNKSPLWKTFSFPFLTVQHPLFPFVDSLPKDLQPIIEEEDTTN